MKILTYIDRKARKEHMCSLCGGVIQSGETYHYARIVNDDMIYDWKEHVNCCQIISNLDELGYISIDPDDGYNMEMFLEGCCDYCHENICVYCDNHSDIGCAFDKDFCLDEVYEDSTAEVEQTREFLRTCLGGY